ncbi:phosphate:Na+ symporter [Acholeplasma morum]|uniref:Na/Pi cotransporter family protein n=1 Tax=Paracholeplasma morum TaxID=264637 RepID=UPI00195DE501|nr:Na/Pi cotransporter family protein [Paracholeplasma morum]MBM7452822.1 phosphate:Na+ symporter [Paracholeplasma morum]
MSETTRNILYILGGLGLFLYGMELMSDSLKRSAGNKMRSIIEKTTNTPIKAIIMGVLLTVIMQSSSATTVLVIGLVTAGLMTLKQSVGVIFGANIGTTVTSIIIGLPIADYALLMIFVSVVMLFFFKRKIIRNIGSVILGLGLIFFGLEVMSDGLKSVVNNPYVQDLFMLFSDTSNRAFWLFGVTFGTLFTAFIQSSSASIGIIQKLYHMNATTGIATFSLIGALPLILGANIGTTITSVMASINGSIESRRLSAIHIMFNVLGTVIFLILLWPYYHVVSWVESTFLTQYSMATLAFAHILMNVVTTVILFFFMDKLIDLSSWLIKEKKRSDELEVIFNESLLQETPSLALYYVKKGINKMGSIARDYFFLTRQYSFENSSESLNRAEKYEHTLDDYDKRLHDYMINLVRKNELSFKDSNRLSRDLDTIRDFERIGDHLTNLIGFFKNRYEENQVLSEGGIEDLRHYYKVLEEMFDMTMASFVYNDVKKAKLAIEYETVTDKLEEKFRLNYVERLKNGELNFTSKTNYVEILSNMERIGDHLKNIAENIINPSRVSRLDDEEVTFK